MVKAEIVAVGNELLLGDVVDTNTNWLCKKITGLGGSVRRSVMVRDDLEAIAVEVKSALNRKADIIFTTGGMGPTSDDMSLDAVAKGVGLPLELNQEASGFVRRKYKELAEAGYIEDEEITEPRKKMAYLPKGAISLDNPVGAAPGSLLKVGSSRIVSLPGVPAELKGIFESSLQSVLKEVFGKGAYDQRVITVDCNDESILAPLLKKVRDNNPQVYVKSRAKRFGNDLKIRVTLSGSGAGREEVDNIIGKALEDLERVLRSSNISIDSVRE